MASLLPGRDADDFPCTCSGQFQRPLRRVGQSQALQTQTGWFMLGCTADVVGSAFLGGLAGPGPPFLCPRSMQRHLKAPPLCHTLAGARGNKAVKAVDCGSIPAQMAAPRLTLGCLPLSPGECGLCSKSVRPHPSSVVLETRPVVPNSQCLLTTCRETGNLIQRLLLVSGGCLRLGLGSHWAQ